MRKSSDLIIQGHGVCGTILVLEYCDRALGVTTRNDYSCSRQKCLPGVELLGTGRDVSELG
jgi:hypothetical protein